MRYTVLWKLQAEDQLAEIWTASSDRNAVSAATHEAERLLQHDPQSRGESRLDDRRVLFVGPLRIAFRVDEGDRKVWILSVHGK